MGNLHIKSMLALALLVVSASCALDKQETPALTGPSELGLSLVVSASPDIITQDGHSQATISVVARDAASQPVSGVTLRLQSLVNGTPVDFGVLSSKVISTGPDGRASTVYQAPSAPPPTQSTDTTVTISVTPVGSNYAATVARQVDLRLARPGVIIPPNAGPNAAFFFSPTTPREDIDVFFDGSASTGSIVSYHWSFGDGRTSSSAEPTARHHYGVIGTYSVVLTVTDHLGRSHTSAPTTVTIASSADPTAALTASPVSPRPHIDTVNFNASGSKASAGRSIVEYQFDFGDGSPFQTGPSPVAQHVYTDALTYTVVLRVMDDTGRYGTATQTVTVEEPE
jgi:PKD repeat protein